MFANTDKKAKRNEQYKGRFNDLCVALSHNTRVWETRS